MKMSKENCKHALENLVSQERFMNDYAYRTIKDFLEVVQKQLPTEAAIERDKNRKKSTSKKS